MDLKWLDDLVALAEEGSLSRAAVRRNTTQPAFSRRIQAIEDWLGTPILDRSMRPARISTAITRHIEDVRLMSRSIKRFRNDIQGWEESHRQVTIATQHALSVTFFPALVAGFHQSHAGSSIRLRSANRDESFSLLMTGQADVLVVYESEQFPLDGDEALIEWSHLRADRFVPIVAKKHSQRLLSAKDELGELHMVAYPDDVFFGRILNAQLLPKLSESLAIKPVCETALVPAVLEMVREGAGIAWVPRSTFNQSNLKGELSEIKTGLLSCPLTVSAMRLKAPRSAIAEELWRDLQAFAANS